MKRSARRASGLLTLLLMLALDSYGEDPRYYLRTISDELHWPWSVAQLPNGEYLVTEREGRLVHLTRFSERRVVEGTPETLFAGQGGYFDVVLHPDFEENRWIYLSYAEGVEDANGTAVFRARYNKDGSLSEGKQVLRVTPDKSTPQHYGGRLVFLGDKTLLVTSGEGFEHREDAQSMESELGKTLRIDSNGRSVGMLGAKGEPPRIWSYGHRNPQGVVLVPETGDIYLHEHGPRGGDELNRILPEKNYGWPLTTFGVDYSGAYVSPFQRAPGVEEPLWTWTPSIAPSGLAWYNGRRFPDWRGSFLVGALVNKEVRRLSLEDGVVHEEEALFSELGERIRDVRVFSDRIFILTDGERGKLLEVLPRNQ